MIAALCGTIVTWDMRTAVPYASAWSWQVPRNARAQAAKRLAWCDVPPSRYIQAHRMHEPLNGDRRPETATAPNMAIRPYCGNRTYVGDRPVYGSYAEARRLRMPRCGCYENEGGEGCLLAIRSFCLNQV